MTGMTFCGDAGWHYRNQSTADIYAGEHAMARLSARFAPNAARFKIFGDNT